MQLTKLKLMDNIFKYTSQLLAVVLIISHCCSCSSDLEKVIDEQIEFSDEELNTPIRDIVSKNFSTNTLFVGATSKYDAIGTEETDLLAKEFSYTTPANDFKQSYVHPDNNIWKWEKSDAWIKFAREQKQIIRIHGPISPQCSRWARNDERSKEELSSNLREFMTALCQRYNNEDVVEWMDVINESVNRDGTWKKAAAGDDGWEMPWETIGYIQVDESSYPHLEGVIPIYIIQAFEIACEEATNKQLIINQHGGMETGMWDKIKDLVRYLRDNGYRVDGIGWQAHISYGRDVQWETPEVDAESLKQLISWAHDNNLEFHVTECNIHVPTDNPGSEQDHMRTYMSIFNTLLEMRHGGVIGFNLWNIKDVPHYKNEKKWVIAPWDEQLEPKTIYVEMKKALLKAHD